MIEIWGHAPFSILTKYEIWGHAPFSISTKWQIRNEEEPKRLLTDRLEVVIIEMPKAIRQYKENKENKISQWMMFLDNPAQKEVVQIMDMNEEIRKAAEELNSMSEDDELRTMAELRLKGLRDEQAAIDYATKRGIEQGEKQGGKKGGKREKAPDQRSKQDAYLRTEKICK